MRWRTAYQHMTMTRTKYMIMTCTVMRKRGRGRRRGGGGGGGGGQDTIRWSAPTDHLGRIRRTFSADFLWRKVPSVTEARAAKDDIESILNPRRNTGYGHKDANLDAHLRHRLELMRSFLVIYYIDPIRGKNWIESSLDAIQIWDAGRQHRTTGKWAARELRQWTKSFIHDRRNLPINQYGKSNVSRIEDEDLRQDVLLHLQGIGKYVRAMDIVNFTKQDDVQKKYDLKKPVCLTTALRWMRRLGYRWSMTPKGQYVDGHERDDVIAYRQTTFIPAWTDLQTRMRTWNEANLELEEDPTRPGRKVVIWHHDESIFYANDRRKTRWVHDTETALPYTKGEGASLMVADFVSADYGWLTSPDKKESARVYFKPGKNQGWLLRVATTSSIKSRRRCPIEPVRCWFWC